MSLKPRTRELISDFRRYRRMSGRPHSAQAKELLSVRKFAQGFRNIRLGLRKIKSDLKP